MPRLSGVRCTQGRPVPHMRLQRNQSWEPSMQHSPPGGIYVLCGTANTSMDGCVRAAMIL